MRLQEEYPATYYDDLHAVNKAAIAAMDTGKTPKSNKAEQKAAKVAAEQASLSARAPSPAPSYHTHRTEPALSSKIVAGCEGEAGCSRSAGGSKDGKAEGCAAPCHTTIV